ncbi:MAG TPA: hypothetical protein VJC16_00820 [Candidatus Nanoarchaeia archaeon]|nr:hypothetical protein [Candidatus Nanoarchaeia archaeon]
MKQEEPDTLYQGMQEMSTDVLKSIQAEKLASFQGTVDDINVLIQLREQLFSEIMNDLEKIKIEVSNVLAETSNRPRADLETIKERLELRKKLAEVDAMKAEEKLNRWRDIAALRKELREWVKEFTEKEGSTGLLDKILKE